MMYHQYPKVIIVSNNSFSETSSNGRTLGGFFKGWPKERIAQFCISTTEPDYSICQNYYMITDKEALTAFLSFRKARRVSIDSNKGTEGNTIIRGKKKSFKTASKALIRNIVWGCKRFASPEFDQWVNDFSPEIVLIQNSDSAFLLKIGMYIAENTNAKISIFNTEGFYFFKTDYMREEYWWDRLCFPVYHALYRSTYRKLMKNVKLAIYANKMLADDYSKEFQHEAYILYTSSEVQFDSNDVDTTNPIFSYLGNFGFDRYRALVEISEVLQIINPSFKLDVYGKYPNEEIAKLFQESPGINSKGFISYSKVKDVIRKSTILFHAEVKDMKFQEGLRYGFSTKIADSIASGHPFLMYSSSQIAGAAYMLETGAGWFAEDKKHLQRCIEEILSNKKAREEVKHTALRVTKENHSSVKNRLMMRTYLCKLNGNSK